MDNDYDTDKLTPRDIINEHLQALYYHIDQGLVPRSSLEYLKSKSTDYLNKTYPSANKERLGLADGISAYRLVLEDDVSAQVALEMIAEYWGWDKSWAEEIKNGKFYHAKEIVNYHKDHPIQEAMDKNGVLHKGILKTSKTPNQQLRNLHKQKKHHNVLEDMKKKTSEHLELISNLQVKTTIMSGDIDHVMEKLATNGMDIKSKVLLLTKEGFTGKQINHALGISLSTIRRIIKEGKTNPI